MLDHDVITRLASIAHDVWRRGLEREGWRPGPRFDPSSKTHDAMVPFDQLSDLDRRHTCLGIEAAELERPLLLAIDYQRGPDREFTADELRAGLPVGIIGAAIEGAPSRGSVESWATDAHGELVINVRWSDGQRSEHLACSRELTRLEEGR